MEAIDASSAAFSHFIMPEILSCKSLRRLQASTAEDHVDRPGEYRRVTFRVPTARAAVAHARQSAALAVRRCHASNSCPAHIVIRHPVGSPDYAPNRADRHVPEESR